MQQLQHSSDQASQRFHFDALVRALCESADMKEHVQATTAVARDKQQHAAAAIQKALVSFENEPLYDVTNTVR